MDAKSQIKQATIEAVVIRANGDRENLGVVSYWHQSRFKRIVWRIRQWLPSS